VEGGSRPNRNGFQEKEVSLADLIHSSARAAAENQLATKRILNIRDAKLLNKRAVPAVSSWRIAAAAVVSGVRRLSVSGWRVTRDQSGKARLP
jgi:hypothetical protein